MPARKTYALVKIAELTDLELALALDEYDAAFSVETSTEEIADDIQALLKYRAGQKRR